jgi:hypothetical protein
MHNQTNQICAQYTYFIITIPKIKENRNTNYQTQTAKLHHLMKTLPSNSDHFKSNANSNSPIPSDKPLYRRKAAAFNCSNTALYRRGKFSIVNSASRRKSSSVSPQLICQNLSLPTHGGTKSSITPKRHTGL